MKYEIIDKVSRFVKRFGMIMDPETMNKAKAEAEEYDFRIISKDHYAVYHDGKMYVIIERYGKVGCSCDDMTFNRMDGSVCKHIIEFSRLMSPPDKKIDKLEESHLMHVCGWTGKELHPEIELDGPGAVVQEDTTPAPNEPEGKIYTRRCKHCDDVFSGRDLAEVKKQHADHLKVCGMNQRAKPWKGSVDPVNEDKPLGDLGVSDRPEEPEQKPEEETKMEGKPAWDQEAWDNATQGSFVSYGENGVAMVLFTANDFDIGDPYKPGGRPVCEFSVIQHKKTVILSVSALGLMNALKKILPLENKLIKICRTGEGTGTKYEVQDVTDTEVI